MKKIYFNEFKLRSWFSFILMLSSFLMIIGLFEFINFQNIEINKYFRIQGFLIQIIFFGKMFLFKNYVEWNKLGMNIKMNCFLAKSVQFSNIKKIELNNDKLSILQIHSSDIAFSTIGIENSDLLKLIEIIKNKL